MVGVLENTGSSIKKNEEEVVLVLVAMSDTVVVFILLIKVLKISACYLLFIIYYTICLNIKF
jgi:hypothetical protein